MTVYADSSFFVSLYLRDRHTPEALRLIAGHPQVWFTPFHSLEFAHALARNLYRKQISSAMASTVQRDLSRDCDSGIWTIVEVPPAAFETGIDLARRYVPALGSRTLDTLHVACALELNATRFWTLDERQARLAKAAGLRTT